MGFLSPAQFRKYEKAVEKWITSLVQEAAVKVALGQPLTLNQLINSVEREIMRAFGDPPDEIVKLIEEQSVAGMKIGEGKLPISFPKEMILDTVPKLVKQHVLSLRNLGSSAAKNAFAQLMEESVRDGDSVDMTAARIQDWAKDHKQVRNMTEWRARTIARTESARAMMQGQSAAWKESGLVEEVEWLGAPNSCQYCKAMDGKKFSRRMIGVPFLKQGAVLRGTDGGRMKADYGDVLGPPLHPNCRCDLLPVIK